MKRKTVNPALIIADGIVIQLESTEGPEELMVRSDLAAGTIFWFQRRPSVYAAKARFRVTGSLRDDSPIRESHMSTLSSRIAWGVVREVLIAM